MKLKKSGGIMSPGYGFAFKIKTFLLASHGGQDIKILTTKNYIKRGGMGPNVCYMCLNGKESISHLLIHC